MMKANIIKMIAELQQPVAYYLPINHQKILLNSLLGQTIRLEFTKNIFCIHCGRKTPKSYQQGYCYLCLRRLGECNYCLIRPEKCLANPETCRHGDWAHAQCLTPHIIYLANTAGVKVGITRTQPLVKRWIDQGASQGLPLLKVQNRYQAGVIEVALRQFISDKTNWRHLLKSAAQMVDLYQVKNELLINSRAALQPCLEQFRQDIEILENQTITTIDYPILSYPQSIQTFDINTNPIITGKLLGIKGQYLFLDTGVLNVRKYCGYEIVFSMLS